MYTVINFYNSADGACSLYDQIFNPEYFQLDDYIYKKIAIDIKMVIVPLRLHVS